jgi:hypothetical protein
MRFPARRSGDSPAAGPDPHTRRSRAKEDVFPQAKRGPGRRAGSPFAGLRTGKDLASPGLLRRGGLRGTDPVGHAHRAGQGRRRVLPPPPGRGHLSAGSRGRDHDARQRAAWQPARGRRNRAWSAASAGRCAVVTVTSADDQAVGLPALSVPSAAIRRPRSMDDGMGSPRNVTGNLGRKHDNRQMVHWAGRLNGRRAAYSVSLAHGKRDHSQDPGCGVRLAWVPPAAVTCGDRLRLWPERGAADLYSERMNRRTGGGAARNPGY